MWWRREAYDPEDDLLNIARRLMGVDAKLDEILDLLREDADESEEED